MRSARAGKTWRAITTHNTWTSNSFDSIRNWNGRSCQEQTTRGKGCLVKIQRHWVSSYFVNLWVKYSIVTLLSLRQKTVQEAFVYKALCATKHKEDRWGDTGSLDFTFQEPSHYTDVTTIQVFLSLPAETSNSSAMIC